MPTKLILAAALVILLSQTGCGYLPFNKNATQPDAKAQIARIDVEVVGVDKSLADTITAHVSLSRKGCNIPGRYLRQLAREATGEASEAMQAFGYYAAIASVEIDEGENCPKVLVTITPGEPVTYSKVDIRFSGEGKDEVAFQQVYVNKGVNVADIVDHGKYKAVKQRIESLAAERGYLEGRFEISTLKVQPANRAAEIEWLYNTGVRYKTGSISISQMPDELDRDLIDRLIEYRPGVPYSVGGIARLNRQLGQSGYFSQTDVRPRLQRPDGHTIPIDIQLTPRARHSFSSGVGASTDEGLRGRADYLNRRVNRRGHRISVGAKASFIEQSLSTSYLIPLEYPADEWLNFQAGIKREDNDSFTSRETQLSVSETKRRPFDILESHYLEFNRQQFEVGDESNTSIFLTPGARWTKSNADDPLYPRNGYALDVEIRGAADALLSDTSFLRGFIRGSWITPAPFRSRILLRADFGAMWVDQFSALPPSERFFTGGDNTVRGYDFEELGPKDADGDVIGGTYLGILSAEYEYLVSKSWAVAAFVDTGNAFGGVGNSTGLATSVGFGVRWRSPIGPVRIDLAHPFDKNDAVVFHLRIGPDL